jgi:uncharacterized membrane protein
MKTFFELHFMGGPIFMIPLTAMLLGIIILGILSWLMMVGKNHPPSTTLKNMILTIIYTGTFAAVWGILGQGLGIYQALYAIQVAGDVSPAMIMGGIKISMIAPLYGIMILLLSSLIWFGLKLRYNSITAIPEPS